MSKEKMGVVRKTVLKLKLASPREVTLNENEAGEVINQWEEELDNTEKSITKIKKAEYSIDRHLEDVKDDKEEVRKNLSDAKRYFKTTKNPVKRREWARRVVIANNTLQSLVDSEKRVRDSVDRTKSYVAEAKLVETALETRIREAKIYRELNGGLKLVGQSLIDARTRFKQFDVEYTNFDINLESLKKEVESRKDENVVKEAETFRHVSRGSAGGSGGGDRVN